MKLDYFLFFPEAVQYAQAAAREIIANNVPTPSSPVLGEFELVLTDLPDELRPDEEDEDEPDELLRELDAVVVTVSDVVEAVVVVVEPSSDPPSIVTVEVVEVTSAVAVVSDVVEFSEESPSIMPGIVVVVFSSLS